MDNRKLVFFCTLCFSIVLEVYVRWISVPSMFTVWPPIDNFMHFFWGLNLFLFIVLYVQWKPRDALLAVFVWQMGWEVAEMIGDRLMVQVAAMLDHFFMDGIKDTFMDLAGATFGWFILHLFGVSDTHESKMSQWMIWFAISIAPLLIVGSLVSFAAGKSADILAIIWIVLGAIGAAVFVRKKN